MRTSLALLAALLTSAPAWAQKSPKENAQIWLGFTCSIYAADTYDVSVQSTQPGEAWPFNGTYTNEQGLNTATSPGNLRAQIYPGRLYSFFVGSNNWTTADIHFDVPAGYTLYLGYDNMDRTPGTSFQANGSTMGSTYHVSFEVRPNDGAAQLAPGYALPPRLDDVTWAVSLGRLNNGSSAGTLRWRSANVTSDLLNSLNLVYAAPADPEISVTYDTDGSVKYISAPQCQVRIFRNSDPTTGYTLNIYPWNANPGSDLGFSGQPLIASYVISAGGTGVPVQIVRTQDGATDTWQYTVDTSNNPTGLKQLNPGTTRVIQSTSLANTPVAGQRTETVTVQYSGGGPAAVTQRVYQTFAWGEELISETADPGGANLTTTYTYYTSNWPTSGNAGKLASVQRPDGSWETYDYYDDFARWGQLAHVYHPWQDSPFGSASSSCQVTTCNYTGERTIYQDLPAGTTTATLGTQTAGSSVAYSFWNQTDYNSGSYGCPMRTETVTNFSTSGASLVTTRKVFDNGVRPGAFTSIGLSNSGYVAASNDFAGRLYSVTNPDGTRVSAAYSLGQWISYFNSGLTGWDTYSFQPGVNNTWWAETYFHGNSTAVAGADATPLTSWNGHAIEPVYLTPYRSLRRDVYTETNDAVVQEVTYVYTGSGNFKVIAWRQTDNVDGLKWDQFDQTGSRWDWRYTFGHLTSETHPDGTQTNYTLDSLFRVTQVQRTGVGATGNFPAQDSLNVTYTYDAADHLVGTSTAPGAGGLLLTTSSSYNLANQLTASTDQRGLSTSYSYANGGRTITATLPGGATKVTDKCLDGSPKSVTGTAQVPAYYTAGVNGDGSITRKTYAASNGGPRWASTTADWLGRTISESHPDPVISGGSNGTFTKTYTYNAAGQLAKTSETGLADTLYQYDGQGSLQYTGLDVNGNGVLDLAGPDRVSQVRSQVYQDTSSGVWYQQNLNYVYNQDNSSAPLLQSENRIRLVPYAGSSADFTNWKVYGETRSYDLFRNLTVQSTVADHTSRLMTVTSTLPDSSVPDVVTTLNGLTVAHQTARNLTYTYNYDGLRRQTQSIDPRTGTTTTSYFTSGTGAIGQVSSVQDPAGDTTSYAYNTTDGRLFSETNALGKAVYHAYDLLGHEIETWGAATYPVSYTFDSYGQRVTMSTYRDGTSWTGTSWPGTGTPDTTTWSYDPATGVLLSKTDAAGHAVSYTYNSCGQLATRTWARGVTTTYAYDANTAEQTGISYSDGTPGLSYTYNRMGQTATVGDATGSRTFAYSPTTTQLQTESMDGSFYVGRVLTRLYDTTTTGAIGRNTGYQLGTSGTPTNNQAIAYGYDTYGRFASVTQANFNFAFNYTYAVNSNLIASLTDGSWTQNYTYESNRDNLSTFESLSGSTSIAKVAYTLDALGRRTGIVHTGLVFSRYLNGGLHTSYGYDDRSEVTSAQTWQGSNPSDSSNPVAARNFGYAFDNIGNRATASVDGTADTYSANNLNQYISRSHYPGVTVTGLAPTSATVTVNGSNAARQGDYYNFGIALGSGSSSAWQSVAVNSSLGGSVTRNTWLPASPQAYTYDADGNLTQDDRWSYTWDAENRLTSMTTIAAAVSAGVPNQQIAFKYDYLGRRAQKTVSTWSGGQWSLVSQTRFLYDGWNLAAEYDSTSGFTLSRTYTWGLDISRTLADAGGVHGLLLESDATTGAQYLPAYDGNGNILGLVNRGTGTLDAAYEYSPFGETIRATGTYAASNPFRFSTKYTDTETGLLYYGFRYYNPSLGRWLGRDPLEEKGGINLYGFVRNNPVNLWDVLGNATQLNTHPLLSRGAGGYGQRIISSSETNIADLTGHPIGWVNPIQQAEQAVLQLANSPADDGGLSAMSHYFSPNEVAATAGLQADLQAQQAAADARNFKVTVGNVKFGAFLGSASPPPASQTAGTTTDGKGLVTTAPNSAVTGYTAMMGDGIGSDGSIPGARGGEANALTPNTSMLDHSVTVQSYIGATSALGFAGDGHGPTSSPSSAFRTTSTILFDPYNPSGVAIVLSDTGTTTFLATGTTGKASSAGLTGSETYVSPGVVRIGMNGSASNPLIPVVAPPITYSTNLTVNFNTGSFGGTVTTGNFPSYQVYINNSSVYSHPESGTPFNLINHSTVRVGGHFP